MIWVTVRCSWPQNCFSFLDDPAYLCSSSLIQIGSQSLICFPHFQVPQCHPCIELASLPTYQHSPFTQCPSLLIFTSLWGLASSSLPKSFLPSNTGILGGLNFTSLFLWTWLTHPWVSLASTVFADGLMNSQSSLHVWGPLLSSNGLVDSLCP